MGTSFGSDSRLSRPSGRSPRKAYQRTGSSAQPRKPVLGSPCICAEVYRQIALTSEGSTLARQGRTWCRSEHCQDRIRVEGHHGALRLEGVLSRRCTALSKRFFAVETDALEPAARVQHCPRQSHAARRSRQFFRQTMSKGGGTDIAATMSVPITTHGANHRPRS
jgi:hypothetical protein